MQLLPFHTATTISHHPSASAQVLDAIMMRQAAERGGVNKKPLSKHHPMNAECLHLAASVAMLSYMCTMECDSATQQQQQPLILHQPHIHKQELALRRQQHLRWAFDLLLRALNAKYGFLSKHCFRTTEEGKKINEGVRKAQQEV